MRSLVLDNWEPELLEVMRNLGNKLVSMVFESHLQSQPLAAQRPQPGDPKAAQFRRNWIEAKWVRRAFVRPIIGAPTTATDTNNTSNVWLMDIYRVWLMQMHSGGNMGSLVPPAFLSSASSTRYSVASSASMHANNKLNAAPLFVDRRRKHSAVPGPTARAQVTLGKSIQHHGIFQSPWIIVCLWWLFLTRHLYCLHCCSHLCDLIQLIVVEHV